jgi:hypothetical protein
MKTIIRSLLMITAVATLATGTTHALFTNTVALSGTFSTGTLHMSLTDGTTTNLNFANLKPGDTVRKWVMLTNDGTLDIGGMTLQTTDVSGDAGLLDQVHVSVIGWNTNPGGNAYFTPGWNTTAGQPVNWYGTAGNVFSSPQWQSGTIPTTLAPGESIQYVLDFTVPTTMDDFWQNKSVTFNMNFTAQQTDGTAYAIWP